jgi:glucosamine 6-phosphate synthetase-like amidotransferase/phosphosugar isomerase protein
MDEKTLELARTWKDFPAYDFIGSGIDYATAWFGTAKVFEATGAFAASINTEEWLHLNFFMRHPENIGTLVVLNARNPALSRARELISYARKLGRPLLLITNSGITGEAGLDALCYTEVPFSDFEHSMLLTQFTPICLLFGYIQTMLGEKNGRGCEGPWSFAKGAVCVRNSEIQIL